MLSMQLDGFVQSNDPRWVAVVPIKANDVAKSRLGEPQKRVPLARAMALDTLNALGDSTRIEHLFVVTPQPDSFPSLDHITFIRDTQNGQLNAALKDAGSIASKRFPDNGIAIVLADTPCLTGDIVDQVLARATDISLVSDTAGTGTTMLLYPPGKVDLIDQPPKFGLHSCAAHTASGARNLTSELPIAVRVRAQRDVDTWVDLWDAVRLGVGHHTQLGWSEYSDHPN